PKTDFHHRLLVMNREFRLEMRQRQYERRSLEDRARGPERDFCVCKPLFLSELRWGFRHICDHRKLALYVSSLTFSMPPFPGLGCPIFPRSSAFLGGGLHLIGVKG